MYAGTLLTNFSGRILGAHQKIDRVAHRHVYKMMPDAPFPPIDLVLHFEGRNGPDGIKIKSPAKDEPWHFFNPFDDDDTRLLSYIENHFSELVSHLRRGNHERAAFEAAWLSHALVDGLTPAHHYPYEERLMELRGGLGIETRTSLKDKILIPGSGIREQVLNNWKMWGPKGLLLTHGFFEDGVALIIAPLSFGNALPHHDELKQFLDLGISEWFRRAAREIAVKDLYGLYYRKGWTPKLTRQIRNHLAPLIIKTVTLSWCGALHEAQNGMVLL